MLCVFTLKYSSVETNKSKIDQLLQKYQEGNCSLEEIEWLQHALSATDIGDQDAIDQAIVTSLLQPSAAGKNKSSKEKKITITYWKKEGKIVCRSRRKPLSPYDGPIGLQRPVYCSLFFQ